MSVLAEKSNEVCDPFGQPVWSDDYIRSQIPQFKWFVHTNFGNGIIAKSTVWPGEPDKSRHAGISKFDFIVRPNLPDLQGKRILDIGCNCGLIAIHMARLGAAEVVGIDCEQGWPSWKKQAEFVKGALEWRCRTTYNVRFIECPMTELCRLDLGQFDIVTALNCIYYLDVEQIKAVVSHIASISKLLLVQCNTKDHNRLFGKRGHPSTLAPILQSNGFPVVRVDWPWDHPRKGFWPQRYHRPVVVGTKD